MTATEQLQALPQAVVLHLLPAVQLAVLVLALHLLLLLLVVGLAQRLVTCIVQLVHLAMPRQAAVEASLQAGQCCQCLLAVAAVLGLQLAVALLVMQLTGQQQQQQQQVVCQLRCSAVRVRGSTRYRLCQRTWMQAQLLLIMMLMMLLRNRDVTSSSSSSTGQ
jgi:hypothetical protein